MMILSLRILTIFFIGRQMSTIEGLRIPTRMSFGERWRRTISRLFKFKFFLASVGKRVKLYTLNMILEL